MRVRTSSYALGLYLSSRSRACEASSPWQKARDSCHGLLVACTTQIGSSVRAKRRWILGVSDEEMFLHSEELTTTKAMPFRPNPLGRWELPAISSLRAVLDAITSTSVSRLDLAGKTHRRCSRFGWYRSLGACRELAPSKQESTTYEPSLVCKLLILGCRPLIPDRLLGHSITQDGAIELESTPMKRRFQIGIALLLSEYILGGVGYKLLSPQTPFLDCLYMSVITVTTVGYAEVIDTAANPLIRSYTLLLILAGVGVMLYAVSVVTAYIVEGDLNQNFWKKRMQRRIDSMKEHFIICGAGETGRRVIEELVQTKRDFVVIDPDSKTVAEFRSEYSNPILQGVSDDQDTLKAAGVERAAGAVVALPNDRDNLVTTLSIRMLNPKIRIVTKEIDPGMADRLRRAGADAVVNPGMIGGLRLVSELVRPSVVMFLDTMLRDKRSTYRFEELSIEGESDWAHQTLAAIPARSKYGLFVVGARRAGEESFTYNPDDSWLVEPGQVLVVLADAADVQRAREDLRAS